MCPIRHHYAGSKVYATQGLGSSVEMRSKIELHLICKIKGMIPWMDHPFLLAID